MNSNSSTVQTNYNNKIDNRKIAVKKVPSGDFLGNNTRLASSQSQQDIQTIDDTQHFKKSSNTIRYKLQENAQRLHPQERVSACMKFMTPGENFVELHYNDDTQHAHYQNLATCDNVWLCPVCAGKITSRRAEEIRQGYSYAIDTLGYRVVMVTYTLSHKKHHELSDLVNLIRQARKKVRSGRSWQDFKTNYGYVGAIASFEVTHGENGWHPHVHEIMFLDNTQALYDLDDQTSDDILEKWLQGELSDQWTKEVKKLGGTASRARGIDVRTASQYIGEYVSKYGHLPQDVHWDVALEISKANRKTDSKGLHPWSILSKCFDETLTIDEQKFYQALWYEYVSVFKGQKQIFWTRGLKDLILQEEVLQEDDQETRIVVRIPSHTWQFILQRKLRSELLNATIECQGERGFINMWINQQRSAYRGQLKALARS